MTTPPYSLVGDGEGCSLSALGVEARFEGEPNLALRSAWAALCELLEAARRASTGGGEQASEAPPPSSRAPAPPSSRPGVSAENPTTTRGTARVRAPRGSVGSEEKRAATRARTKAWREAKRDREAGSTGDAYADVSVTDDAHKRHQPARISVTGDAYADVSVTDLAGLAGPVSGSSSLSSGISPEKYEEKTQSESAREGESISVTVSVTGDAYAISVTDAHKRHQAPEAEPPPSPALSFLEPDEEHARDLLLSRGVFSPSELAAQDALSLPPPSRPLSPAPPSVASPPADAPVDLDQPLPAWGMGRFEALRMSMGSTTVDPLLTWKAFVADVARKRGEHRPAALDAPSWQAWLVREWGFAKRDAARVRGRSPPAAHTTQNDATWKRDPSGGFLALDNRTPDPGDT